MYTGERKKEKNSSRPNRQSDSMRKTPTLADDRRITYLTPRNGAGGIVVDTQRERTRLQIKGPSPASGRKPTGTTNKKKKADPLHSHQ